MRSSKIWASAARRGAALGLVAALAACSQGQIGPRAALEEETRKEDPLPPFPPHSRPEDLARINTGPGGGFEFFVDTASVQVLGKGEFRYTLLARSNSGAANLSYEGLRCLLRERRLYAVGRPDGTWAPARKSAWSAYSRSEHSQIPVILSEDYLCPGRMPVATVAEAVQALRYGGSR